MNVEVVNENGKVIEAIEVPRGVFDAAWNPTLVHQVFVVQQANRRQPTAHTKDRAEVAGGGRNTPVGRGTDPRDRRCGPAVVLSSDRGTIAVSRKKSERACAAPHFSRRFRKNSRMVR